jgi:hypothetical protein
VRNPLVQFAVRPLSRQRRSRARALAGSALLMVSLLGIGTTDVLAADQPVKILATSITWAPVDVTMTVNSMTYSRVTRTATVSVTPNCYWVNLGTDGPDGPPHIFLTGVGGADFVAVQRGQTWHAYVLGGVCEVPITLTIDGLQPGVATLSVGVLLYAEHANEQVISYRVVLR